MFQHKLALLRAQFRAAELLALDPTRPGRESFSIALAGMQHSIDQLQSAIASPDTVAASAEHSNGLHPHSATSSPPVPLPASDMHAPYVMTRTVQEVARSEARKAAVLEACLDAVITIDDHGDVLEFNSAAEAMFGFRREEIVGLDLVAHIVPLAAQAVAYENLANYRISGNSELFGRRFEAHARRSDGTEFPVEVAIVPIAVTDPFVVTIYVLDATARRKAESDVRRYQARLRSLTADLLISEERERRQLALDLHDGLSQTIALAQIKLSSLRGGIPSAQAGALQEIRDLIDQANAAARTIGFELSPPMLHDLGLEPALQWLVENIQARYGITIDMTVQGDAEPADEPTRVILFRSVRELLINAAKHARAHTVHVRLTSEIDRLSAEVEDDGVGMQTAELGTEGFGLFSIHERLSHVGGEMHIDSKPGKGTRVQLYAPIASRNRSEARVRA